jgi:hypothetical protein
VCRAEGGASVALDRAASAGTRRERLPDAITADVLARLATILG